MMETKEQKPCLCPLCEMFEDHAGVVRGIISAAGKLPTLVDGLFKMGFEAGIEEVATRTDLGAGDGHSQMQDLSGHIIDLISGKCTLVYSDALKAGETLAGIITQRDSLLSVNKQLVEALEEADYILSRIVQNGEYKPLDVGAVKELHNRSRAAILAAKASS